MPSHATDVPKVWKAPQSTPKVGAAASPQQTAPTYPKTLPNGDILLDSVSRGRHTLTITNLKDPTQFMPFFAECNCGFHSRTKTEPEVREQVEKHLQRHVSDKVVGDLPVGKGVKQNG